MKEKKFKKDDMLSAEDELILSQTKPYATASIICCLLAAFCLAFIGFRTREPAFWLCILTLLLNAGFLLFSLLKSGKIRRH